ncbi:FAD:protein FMN transferase [Falsiroseomonas sp. CW058]|uniref:FAD:protein FMN transferase n=1 Tax=Falsiroseomonas sp. CW058 TaxID=3388664 RepID=UPI003D317794
MRRREFCILGATAGFALPGRTRADAPLATWTGRVLGAVGSIALHHEDPARARRLLSDCVAEIARLEAVFSLWQPGSALAELNRSGVLAPPPPEMVRLLMQARRVSALTDGVFDVTVQPLWALHREYFAAHGPAAPGPSAEALAAALALVDARRMAVSPDRIALGRRGMAVTLNGIAQGFVTDAVVGLLRQGGVAHTLVDLGEARAVGAHPSGRPWRAALDDPGRPGLPWAELDLADRALATSGDAGFVFDAAGRFTHLLDPRTGTSPRRHRAVSVLAPDATLADALSTAFALMPEAAIARSLAALPGVEARLLRHDGSVAAIQGGGA